MSAATDACQRLRAERDELRAKVRAVEALAEEWGHKANGLEVGAGIGLRRHVTELRAALDGAATNNETSQS